MTNDIRGGVVSVAQYGGDLTFTLRGSLTSPVFGARPLVYYVKYMIRVVPQAETPTVNVMLTNSSVQYGDIDIVMASTNVRHWSSESNNKNEGGTPSVK